VFYFAYEVTAIREGQLTLMHDDFSREEADDIIAYLVTLFFVSLLPLMHTFQCFFLSSVFIVCSCVLRVRVL